MYRETLIKRSKWPRFDLIRLPDDIAYQRIEQVLSANNVLYSLVFDYLPLAAYLNDRYLLSNLHVIGINGAQGAGKSTSATLLKFLLESLYGLKTAVISIDDLYYPCKQRQILSDNVHSLLKIRGVPGTHDVDMGIELFKELSLGNTIMLPKFDKSIDDRMPENTWELVSNYHLVIFEGWFVGSNPQTSGMLDIPVNKLEEVYDNSGIWRRYVNEQLSNEYQKLFSYIDYLIMLKVPSMKQVYKWRKQQEHELIASTGKGMTDEEIDHFIMHFERLTCHQLEDMPQYSDVIFELDEDHSIKNIFLNS